MNLNTYLLSEDSLTVSLDGRPTTVASDHPRFEQAVELCRARDWEGVARCLDIGAVVEDWTQGNITIRDRRTVMYKDKPLDAFLAQKLMAFVWADQPWRPLAMFIDNLMENPSRRSIEQLYTFLEHKTLPVTDDGHFLAYKAVRNDWMDKHSGTVSNHIGARPKMERNQVDDDPRSACSRGFHVGSLEYVAGFGRGDDITVICKVNPRDVVSVPFDSNCQKVRCCEYEVVGLYDGPLPDLYYEGDYIGTFEWDAEFPEWGDEDDEPEAEAIQAGKVQTGNQLWDQV